MDSRKYCEEIESKFQKLEYITVDKISAKMLTSPKSKYENGKLFLFILSGVAISSDISEKLLKYAKSVTFYDDPAQKEKISVIILYIADSVSEKAKTEIEKSRSFANTDAVTAVLCDSKLTFHTRRRLFGKSVKSLLNAAKKLLNSNLLTEE